MTSSADSLLPAPASLQTRLEAALPEFGRVRGVLSTGSTNADLMAQVREQTSVPLPWLLGSHHQQAGRGRAGRAWTDKPGQALMFSCAFESTRTPAAFVSLGPAIGVASCEALRTLVASTPAQQITMKWPNDLMLGEGKLAGILIESQRHAGGTRLVIGMGLNLTGAKALSSELQRPVAALSTLCPRLPDVVTLVSALARTWQQAVDVVQNAGFVAWVDRHALVDHLRQRTVDIIDQHRTLFSGVALGVAPDGSLQVKTETGVQSVTVGDVSVRPQHQALEADGRC